MKKIRIFLFALVCIVVASCNHRNGSVDISYKDAPRYYSMNADFGKSKTSAVEHYLDQQIGSKNNMSFVNVQVDALLTLNDHTNFYLKKSPGHINIQLNKNENSFAAYLRIKSICEGIKNVLTN